MLASLPRTELVLWALATLLVLALLGTIVTRRLLAQFPFFASYLGINLSQTILQVYVYQNYGTVARFPYALIWSSQAVVSMSRAAAAAEFCHRVLGKFRGIWGLAWRILLGGATLVLVLAFFFGKDGMRYAVMTIDIGLEAFVATLAVGTFLFVRYYDAPIERGDLLLGLGLGAYSCLQVLNDLIVTRFFKAYASFWNEAGIAAFLCAELVWVAAMFATSPQRVVAPAVRPDDEEYRSLMPLINDRLWRLNQQLMEFLKMERPKK